MNFTFTFINKNKGKMHLRGRNGRSVSFTLTTLRELSGHKVGDGRLDSVVESTQLILG